MNYKRFEEAHPVDIATGEGTHQMKEAGKKKLFATLKDSFWHTRAAAGLSLGKCRAEGAFEALKELSKDGNLDVRMASAVAMGFTGKPEATPHLLSILESKKTATRIASASALALGLLGEVSATNALIKTAQKAKNAELRATALVGLGLSGDERALPALEKMLFSSGDNRDVLSMGVWAYARIISGFPKEDTEKIQKEMKKLLRLLGSRYREVRQAAAAALADIPSDDVAKVLERVASRDSDPLVRGYALMSLAWRSRRGESNNASRLFTAAFNKEKHVDRRGYAIVAAGLSQDPEMMDWIVQVFGSTKNQDMRCAAALALGLGQFDGASETLKPVALGDKTSYELRKWACIGLGLTKDRSATPMLKRILMFGNSRSAREIVGQQTYTRYFAAQALALIGDPSAVPVLEKTLADQNIYVKGAAAAALGPFQAATSIKALSEAINGEKFGNMRANFASALGNVMIVKEVRETLSDLPRGFSVPSAKQFGLLYLLLTLE
jgi:HEAT repeat protein